ncbi:MAG: hypothetical protein AAF353_19495 [Pseudomonadota bacterium]
MMLGDTGDNTASNLVPASEAIAKTHQKDTALENDALYVYLDVAGQKAAIVDFHDHDKTKAYLQRAEQPLAGVVWVVSGAHGVSPKHNELLTLAKASNIPLIAVFLGNTHLIDDTELLDMVENLEIADTLKAVGYPPTPVIRGSARQILDGQTKSVDPIWQLVRRIETHLISLLSS